MSTSATHNVTAEKKTFQFFMFNQFELCRFGELFHGDAATNNAWAFLTQNDVKVCV